MRSFISIDQFGDCSLLKNVSALFDSSGTPQAKFEYMPYGEMLTTEGAWASAMPFCYSSEYRDGDLGLVYYNYRHYNPRDGRWISRDPLGEEDGENLYGFIGNQVTLGTDFIGLRRQTYDSKKEAIFAARDIVLQAMMEKYETLKEYGLIKNKSNSWPEVWRNLKEKKPEWYQRLKANKAKNLDKWEYGARISCNGKGKYYVAEVGTSFIFKEVVPQETPPCEEGDIMVAFVHSHPEKCPAFSTGDENVAKNGKPFIPSRKRIPARIMVVSTVYTGGPNNQTKTYIYDGATRKRASYLDNIEKTCSIPELKEKKTCGK